MKAVYAALCVVGLALPYYYFVPFVLTHGLNAQLFINQLFQNQISAFFGADVLVSSFVLWAFMFHETRQRRIRLWWLCVVGNVAVGVSLGWPLFLLLREIEREKERHRGLAA